MPLGDPLSTAGLPRPDPARGVFETLLVVDGHPVELDAHLDRLAASARALYGDGPAARIAGPARALATARAEAPAYGTRSTLARLRLTLVPDSSGRLDLDATRTPVADSLVFPPPSPGTTLAPIMLAGGLGRHKWADRRLLEQAGEQLGAVPLIVDDDGSVLEAERANVFAIVDGALVTPPADGRILPGVGRRRILEVARQLGIPSSERSTSLDDLLGADEAFLTGSVRGVEPIAAIGTTTMPAPGAIAGQVAGRLRHRWLSRA